MNCFFDGNGFAIIISPPEDKLRLLFSQNERRHETLVELGTLHMALTRNPKCLSWDQTQTFLVGGEHIDHCANTAVPVHDYHNVMNITFSMSIPLPWIYNIMNNHLTGVHQMSHLLFHLVLLIITVAKYSMEICNSLYMKPIEFYPHNYLHYLNGRFFNFKW